MYYDNKRLKDKITNYLQQVDPNKSILGLAISGIIKHEFNFDNLIKLCVENYYDNKDGMISVVGEVPMVLILKYSQS